MHRREKKKRDDRRGMIGVNKRTFFFFKKKNVVVEILYDDLSYRIDCFTANEMRPKFQGALIEAGQVLYTQEGQAKYEYGFVSKCGDWFDG